MIGSAGIALNKIIWDRNDDLAVIEGIATKRQYRLRGRSRKVLLGSLEGLQESWNVQAFAPSRQKF